MIGKMWREGGRGGGGRVKDDSKLSSLRDSMTPLIGTYAIQVWAGKIINCRFFRTY